MHRPHSVDEAARILGTTPPSLRDVIARTGAQLRPRAGLDDLGLLGCGLYTVGRAHGISAPVLVTLAHAVARGHGEMVAPLGLRKIRLGARAVTWRLEFVPDGAPPTLLVAQLLDEAATLCGVQA